MPAPKPRKIINGIEHVTCPKCGKWNRLEENRSRSHMCKPCRVAYLRDYHERKRTGEIPDRDVITQEQIERELKGGPLSGLYEGCSHEQIRALQMGDVELLLRT